MQSLVGKDPTDFANNLISKDFNSKKILKPLKIQPTQNKSWMLN